MVAAALFVTQVNAAFIDGQMGYSTQFDPAMLWDVNPLTRTVTIGHGEVDTGVGDLALLPTELIAPVVFNYGASFVPLTLWTAGDFSFELQSVVFHYESNDFLALSGRGIIYSSNPNFESTAAAWQFTGNVFTYSAGTIATPTIVPVPAALWLFASAIGALCLSRFKNS
jgi:hypothetical protein